MRISIPFFEATKHGMSFIMIETFNSVAFEWVDRFT